MNSSQYTTLKKLTLIKNYKEVSSHSSRMLHQKVWKEYGERESHYTVGSPNVGAATQENDMEIP